MPTEAGEDWLYGNDWSGSLERVIYRELGGLPDCVLTEGVKCLDCPFGDPGACPVLQDPDVRSYLRWQGERTIEYYRDREKKIEALKRVFRNHRLPLHWEIVARIVQGESPDLFDSPKSVRSVLFLNQDIFQHTGGGIVELRQQ